MAKDCSFDIVSEYDKQELVNAVDQVKRELTTRFDLKNSNSKVELEQDKQIVITTNDAMQLKNILDILQSKVRYKKWYFGCGHKDKYISPKMQSVYEEVYKLGE